MTALLRLEAAGITRRHTVGPGLRVHDATAIFDMYETMSITMDDPAAAEERDLDRQALRTGREPSRPLQDADAAQETSPPTINPTNGSACQWPTALYGTTATPPRHQATRQRTRPKPVPGSQRTFNQPRKFPEQPSGRTSLTRAVVAPAGDCGVSRPSILATGTDVTLLTTQTFAVWKPFPVRSSLETMTAADLAAAKRAAGEIIDAGVGTVLLFGSLARGDATPASDIDLVAIYDDLGDYSDRATRRCRLEAMARSAAGCPVDVIVTDAPEWEVRTTKVPCSVEAGIASDATQLADSGDHTRIDWDKEVGLPATPAAELQARFADMSLAVSWLERDLTPIPAEVDAVDEGDTEELQILEQGRFASAMAQVLTIVESAAKIAHIVALGTTPPRQHEIPKLLKSQPQTVRETFATTVGNDINLDYLHAWRQGATYVADRPRIPTDDELRASSNAALRLTTVVADQCRVRNVSQSELARWERRKQRCLVALDGPIRVQAQPGRGLDL